MSAEEHASFLTLKDQELAARERDEPHIAIYFGHGILRVWSTQQRKTWEYAWYSMYISTKCWMAKNE